MHKLVFTLLLQHFFVYLCEEFSGSFYQAWLFDAFSDYLN